jgi:hypothetical protein
MTEAANKTTVRFTAADYIYNTKRDLVDEEVREILGWGQSDAIDYARQECFQKRTTAIKKVLEKMTVRDREDVDAEVENLKRNGLPPEIQRQ